MFTWKVWVGSTLGLALVSCSFETRLLFGCSAGRREAFCWSKWRMKMKRVAFDCSRMNLRGIVATSSL